MRSRQLHVRKDIAVENLEPWRRDFLAFANKVVQVGVRAVHEPYGPSRPGAPLVPERMILSAPSRAPAGPRGTRAQEPVVANFMPRDCNGLVLEMSTMKVLAVPPKQFITTIDVDATNIQIAAGRYEMLEVEDGTTITLYNYKDAWRIATANGIDVGHIKWNTVTYNEALSECLRHAGLDPETFYAALDKGRSYTLGFRHPDFHPFGKGDADATKIWAIQSASLADASYNFDAFGGLAAQAATVPPPNVRALFKKLTTALQSFLERGEVNFGYILRPKVGRGPTPPPVLLESSLLRAIRHMHYSRTLTRDASSMQYDRIKYIVLRAFLSPDSRTFIMLFPCYTAEYEALDNIVRKLAGLALGLMAPAPGDVDNAYMAAAITVRENMGKILSQKTVISTAMVTSYIRSPTYIDMIYRLWTAA